MADGDAKAIRKRVENRGAGETVPQYQCAGFDRKMDEKVAEVLRLEGNEYFRLKSYHKAIDCYTKSLRYHLTAATLSNRAQAFLFIKCNEKALMDAKKAMCLDPHSIKAIYRHAVALTNLHLYEMAIEDLKRIMEIDANNKETIKLYNDIKDKKNDDEIRLECANKCVSIRSEQPLKQITNIRVKQSSSLINININNNKEHFKSPQQEGNNKKGTSIGIPSAPSTSYQFICDYTILKDYPDKFAQYFMMINEDDYVSILGDIIESDMLDVLINGYHLIICENNSNEIIQSIIQLANVPRFDIASMFLDKQHKQQLYSLMEQANVDDSRRKFIEEIYHL